MAGPAAAAVAMVLAVLVSASGAAHASAAYELRLANTSAIPFHLLDNPFKGGRALLADPKEQWEEWERIGRYSQIANPQMPDKHSSTGQVAIHSVLLPQSYKILVFGRNLPLSGPKSKPEPGVGGNVSTVYDVKTGTYVVTPNYETLFCAGHTIASDGMVVAAGGDMGVIGGKNRYNFMKEGRDVVRLFDRKTLKWTTLPGVKLSEYRWYPTQVVLPDDRVIIVSGFLDDPGRPTGKPAPSIDIFDYKTKRITVRKSRYDLGKKFFTNITPGYQLYPTVLLLPWTDPDAPDDHFLLMYTCRTGQIVRLTKDNQFLPLWNFPGLEPQGMCAAFSAMGSSVLMPFRPERDYEVEFAMFGGGTQGKGLDCKGICNEPASKYIFRMKLPTVKQALAGEWPKYWAFTGAKQYEEMPWPRVFADAVLLPNGKILVCNGAQRGVPGGTIDGGSTAKQGAYTALLYDPDKPAGKRITTLATSKIHRRGSAAGRLGNAKSECVDNCKEGGLAPAGQEYRAELLQLPYAFVDRPVITSVSKENVKYGEKITIGYKHGKAVTAATITPPSANTHSTNMMQRVIFLKTSGVTPDSITVELPSLKSRVANPGYYMLWILEGDVPAKEARWIKLG
ncbi:glyoxal or galactose oxidase [Monoraphidium neglectum]|uniref:Glyoxal or galactose oxidase n=1 Tax=Monoraphidium neglectum TaxID=145388 RepID=A0A0D2ML51_9CHLO|nr:glyoxal or galactose oxidase [Monoraphidium neglectum]KIZ03620.1 glyoxal or galactose oxidase [Monoraphidium neglectum]|eukprot:XP_013902639.1 glyoxal or galactose oxidase [Monoraphidium neglectum]